MSFLKKGLLATAFISFFAYVIPVQADEFDDMYGIKDQCKPGRRQAYAINYEHIGVPLGKVYTSNDLKKAIIAAAEEQGWKLTTTGGNSITASLLVRNKHTSIVDISWKASEYSIKYKNSVNLRAELCNNKVIIHKNYNVWVGNLKKAIDLNISQLDSVTTN